MYPHHTVHETPVPIPLTRLAPSPTGALHLGNARTFLINWALARANNWRIVLRIEDLDTPRVKPGVVESTIDTLAWLGLDWDESPTIQSTRLEHHTNAMRRLAAASCVYPCELTRTQIDAAASAPHDTDHEQRFDPALRPDTIPTTFDDTGTNWRFLVEHGPVTFTDDFAGPQSIDVHDTVGDFVVWTKRAAPSYQLAVVVDDHDQSVTHIVRGDDLLHSAARQILLRNALGYTDTIRYTHLPLVRGPDGRRLAKRHGDTRIDHYRAQGTTPERLIGLLAFWSGITPARTPMTAAEFRERFALDRLPPRDITFTDEDDHWLTTP